MQVQHEACLIEPSRASFAEHPDKSLDSYCLLPALSNSLSPIEHIAICPSGGSSTSLLAVHLSANNQIVIIDTRSHQRRDKFPLKAYDKKFSKQSFYVNGLAFSPDGQRLAVGQTDCVIYIYKLAHGGNQAPGTSQLPSTSSQTSGDAAAGAAAASKTTISGKFASSSPVTCLIWPELGLIFGGQDGKVRLILSFNKAPQSAGGATNDPNSRTSGQNQHQQQQQASPTKVVTLFTGSKGDATPICLAYKAPILLVGLSNRTIQVLMFSTSGGADEVGLIDSSFTGDLMSQLVALSSRRNSSIANSAQAPTVLQSHTIEHSCPPVNLNLIHLNHTLVVCCSGPDGKIAFHSLGASQASNGTRLSIISQLQQTINVREDILATDYSHINEILALTTRNRLLFVRYDQQPKEAANVEGPDDSTAEQCWRLQASTIELRRVFALTSIRWTRDGTQIVLGGSGNLLELFLCQWSKQSMNEKLDICHIGRNRIRITDSERNLLATYKTLYDIKRVNLLDGGQSVLVWTTNSLLLAKLGGPQSEINWSWAGEGSSPRNTTPKSSSSSAPPGSKFLFDPNSDYVIIQPHEASRELRLLKLGQDSVTLIVQLSVSAITSDTCIIKRRLLSVCQFPPSPRCCAIATGDAKRPSLSPNRITTGRASLVSNSNSNSSRQSLAQQQAQRNSSSGINETVNAFQLLDETATNEQLDYQLIAPIRVELFAHLSSQYQLEIIDLRNSNQLIYSHRHAYQIEWLAFGYTGRLLAFLDASSQLNLLRIKQHAASNLDQTQAQGLGLDQDGDSPSEELEFELEVLLKDCESKSRVRWLPESDSLVAQANAIVYIWHDLHERGSLVVEKFDTRSYNFLRKAPIMDLSVSSGSQAQDNNLSNCDYPTIVALINPQPDEELAIELTNNQHIRLDTTKIQFYAKLALGSLESAMELLNKLASKSLVNASHNRLYAKLGWMAIERAQCELAWRIFNKLQYKPLARYLEQCIAIAMEIIVTTNDTTTTGSSRQACMLAKLCGDWDKFERTLAHDQEQVIATYKRLNKWTRLVEFLARKQQFRQRDLAEQDQIAWLIERNRPREAAELKATSSGDLAGALELLLARSSSGPDEACEFALRNAQMFCHALSATTTTDTGHRNELRLGDLLEIEICNKLVASKESVKLAKAAEICDRLLGDFRRALELYLEAGHYEAALRVAQGHSETADRIDKIRLQCADDLRNKFLADRFQTSGKRARAAIDLYLECNHVARALEMANQLHSIERGNEILIRHWDELKSLKKGDQCEIVLRECRELARQQLLAQEASEHTKARAALEMAEDYARLVEILIEQDDLERAFEVSMGHLHAGNRSSTSAEFIELAESYVTVTQADTSKEKLITKAERIFLLVGRAELAIEMHEKLGNYDRMLELIERHQTADQLEASLLHLARSLEIAGELAQAEKYLLRASPSEWTSVVRMYRLAKRWPDAFRVARANCLSEQDPLLVQLAYWWAKSLIVEAPPGGGGGGGGQQNQLAKFAQARDLLHKLCLFEQVVEFACETKNYQFALDVCEVDHSEESQPPPSDRVKRQLILRYATFLEQQHKFAEAEMLLIDNNLIELAAKMHIDNDQHTEAIRVIEQQIEAAGGGDTTQTEVEQSGGCRRRQLVDLLNSTLVECAQRILADLSESKRRNSSLLMRPSTTESHRAAQSWGEKLQMAQQMLLRAQRPELAVEMYQSLGMWQEAIQVAQRFAPRLLEGVELALEQQVQADIEPILRQTAHVTSASTEQPASSSSSSGGGGGDTKSLASSSAASIDQRLVLAADKNLTRPSGVKAAGAGQATPLAAWRQFEFAYRQNDRMGARLHFDKYLSLLLANVELQLIGREADSPGQVARQLRHLCKFLANCKRNLPSSIVTIDDGQAESNLIISILRQQDTSDKIKRLAELIFMLEPNWCSLDLSCVIQSHVTWSSLRNILADRAQLVARATSAHHESQPDGLTESLLVVAHYVTLYVSLVRHLVDETNSLERLTIKQAELLAARRVPGQDFAVDLLSKLSFSLLRHANLLPLGRALHLAGVWQLAAGHPALARQLWSGLLEWHDSSANFPTSVNGSSARVGVSSVETATRLPAPAVLGQFVANLPSNFMILSSTGAPASSLDLAVSHVRHWLLETLIGPASGAQGAAHEPAPVWARLDANSLACLACGLPVPSVGSLHLGARVALRPHELDELLNLCSDAQSDSDAGVPLTSRLNGALERWRRRRRRRKSTTAAQKSTGNGPRNTSSAADQLGEVVDFIIDLAELATLDSAEGR